MANRRQTSSGTTPPSKKDIAAQQRRAKAAQRAAQARRAARRRRWIRWGAAAAAVLAVTGGITILVTRGEESSAPVARAPRVGGDLHAITAIGDALYVSGHEAAAVSHDGGRQWRQITSLDGADAMGWAVTGDAVLAGGHPGLYRSTDNGTTFAKLTGAATVPDAHALGGSGDTVYLGSPQAGLMASTDGGQSWQPRNAQAGRSFMGTILVDPANRDRLIAPDMSQGLVSSTDGGRAWKPLGGPTAAMAVTWNPGDTRQIIAVGSTGSARSSDGGTTWQKVQMPAGVSAVTYDSAGSTVYAAALDGDRAALYRSTDAGTTWNPTS